MSIIHLTQQIDSDTLHLPELRPLIGKQVEITIREISRPAADSPDHWAALEAVSGKDLVDPDVCMAYREFDKRNWNPQK